MKCTRCGEETDVQYRLDDVTPAFQGVCKRCALYWSVTGIVCYDCGCTLGRAAHELRGHYYCEECFLQEAKIPKE